MRVTRGPGDGCLRVSYLKTEFLDGLLLSLAYKALRVAARDIAGVVTDSG